MIFSSPAFEYSTRFTWPSTTMKKCCAGWPRSNSTWPASAVLDAARGEHTLQLCGRQPGEQVVRAYAGERRDVRAIVLLMTPSPRMGLCSFPVRAWFNVGPRYSSQKCQAGDGLVPR